MHRPHRNLALVALLLVLTGCGNDLDTTTERQISTDMPTATVPDLDAALRTRVERNAQIARDRAWYAEMARQMRETDDARQLLAAQERTESSSQRSSGSLPDGTGVYEGAPASATGPGGHNLPGPTLSKYLTAVIPPELVPFADCVAEHESLGAGLYSAVNPSGKYRGWLQADASFWRSHAPAEWKWMADARNWETAPPEVQDQTFVNGYRNQGAGAWSGPGGAICREYRI